MPRRKLKVLYTQSRFEYFYDTMVVLNTYLSTSRSSLSSLGQHRRGIDAMSAL
jgi:hypothetical protein